MVNAKQADFDRWAAELESRYAARSVPKKNETSEEIIQNNLWSYDQQFQGLKLCTNCGYPLEDDRGFYVAEVGPCCWICHDMDNALRQTKKGVHFGTIFEWFDAAHKQWGIYEERSKKIRNHDDGLMW